MVKGVGYLYGNRPEHRADVLAPMIIEAQQAIKAATADGYTRGVDVLKGAAPEFMQLFSMAMGNSPMGAAIAQLSSQISQVLSEFTGKDVSLTTPLSTGIVPFDLVAPAKLIYPVYTPFRNKLPRVPGQGTSRRAKIITGIGGSQTPAGSNAPVDISLAEFPGGGSFSNWPVQLPASSTHTAIDYTIPYRFFGLTEPISWLSQFAGQGFQDISGLANLILLQKFMLGEEYQLVGGVNGASGITAPTAATTAARTAGTGETALSGVTTNVYVVVTAKNYFGETAYAAGNVATQAWSAGQVIDVTLATTKGNLQYNVYLATGAANPGRTGFWLYKTVGGSKITLTGALPTSGTNPPAADSGTTSANRYDGLVSILSGQAAGGTYPAGVQAGYYLPNAQSQARVSMFNTMLEQLWAVTKADPAEIVMEGSDIGRLSDDIRTNANQNYRLMITQSEISNLMAGAAVAEFANPVTRKVIPLMVHPWLTQGTAMALSYTLPFAWSETPNVWEVSNVQDYLSIAWPVIDVTFRYSMFLYGALVGYAPIYCGLIQGIQVSDSNPWS